MVPVVLAMLALVVLVVVGEEVARETPRWLVAVDVAVGLLGIALLVADERGRLRPALALVALGVVSPAATPLAATAILWLAQRQPLRVAVGAATTAVAALVLRGVLRPTHGIELGWWVVLVVAIHAAVVGWGAMLQAHHRLVASLDERARRAESDQAARVARARQDERVALAREMHDVLAHRLSLLTTYAGALAYRADASPDEVRQAHEVIRASAHQAMEDLRDVIGVLRAHDDDPRRPVPTLEDLPRLLAECREAGMAVQLSDDLGDDRGDLSPVTGRTGYRLVQEALTNVRRHAPGATAEVHLAGDGDTGLEVVVSNAAPASPDVSTRDELPPGSGTGLAGLAERVLQARGSLHHGPTPDGGYRVRAHLPWSS